MGLRCVTVMPPRHIILSPRRVIPLLIIPHRVVVSLCRCVVGVVFGRVESWWVGRVNNLPGAQTMCDVVWALWLVITTIVTREAPLAVAATLLA